MYRSIIRQSARQLSASARPILTPSATRGYAAHATPQPFNWEDPLDYKSLLTEEELAIQETAESYCQERMLPRVLRTSLPFQLVEWRLTLHRGISRRALRQENPRRNGRTRSTRSNDKGLRVCRRIQCSLRADHQSRRASRQWLSLWDVRPILPRNGRNR